MITNLVATFLKDWMSKLLRNNDFARLFRIRRRRYFDSQLEAYIVNFPHKQVAENVPCKLQDFLIYQNKIKKCQAFSLHNIQVCWIHQNKKKESSWLDVLIQYICKNHVRIVDTHIGSKLFNNKHTHTHIYIGSKLEFLF